MTPGGRRILIRAIGALASAMLLTGCLSLPDRPARPTPTQTWRVPTATDVQALRTQLEAIDGVTDVDLTYTPESFGNGAATEATLKTASTDQTELNRILDTAFRIAWANPGVAFGSFFFVALNSAAGQRATAADLGMGGFVPSLEDLTSRYGPPETPLTPTPSTTPSPR